MCIYELYVQKIDQKSGWRLNKVGKVLASKAKDDVGGTEVRLTDGRNSFARETRPENSAMFQLSSRMNRIIESSVILQRGIHF